MKRSSPFEFERKSMETEKTTGPEFPNGVKAIKNWGRKKESQQILGSEIRKKSNIAGL